MWELLRRSDDNIVSLDVVTAMMVKVCTAVKQNTNGAVGRVLDLIWANLASLTARTESPRAGPHRVRRSTQHRGLLG